MLGLDSNAEATASSQEIQKCRITFGINLRDWVCTQVQTTASSEVIKSQRKIKSETQVVIQAVDNKGLK
jgi:hypothetical protein